MVIFDKIGHMISDESWEELHQFAHKIGLKREWFQEKEDLSHYDLTTQRMKVRAVHFGARLVTPREIVKALNKLKTPA